MVKANIEMCHLKLSKKIGMLLFLGGCFAHSVWAQLDPTFSQYIYNQSLINPAYAGAREGELDVGAQYRLQWANFKGAPRTIGLFGHYGLSDKMELNFSAYRDEAAEGAIREDNIYADYAYVVFLNDDWRLSFGLKAGFTLYNADLTELDTGNPIFDPSLGQDVNDFYPNIGAGAYIFSERFFFGISSPNLISSNQLKTSDGIVATSQESFHFYANIGHVWEINPDVMLIRGSALTRIIEGSPITADFNLSTLLYNRFEFSVGYRTNETVLASFSMFLRPTVLFSYTYDYTYSLVQNFSSGSHEFGLIFRIFTGDRIVNCEYCYYQPRYF